MPKQTPQAGESDARRRFLSTGLRAIAGTAIAVPFQALLERRAAGQPLRGSDYGELIPIADEATGLPLLKLPGGFRYRSFGWTGDPLDDGTPTPANHDGMAVVAEAGDRVVITRNHELIKNGVSLGGDSISYDALAPGGTTNLVFNKRTGEFEQSRISLAGTLKNCAGGPTPWNSWLSCEETVVSPGDLIDATTGEAMRCEQDHGWVFEVPAHDPASPEPIREMGRFVHEAVAVDPQTGIVYLTEDRAVAAGFYRFVPKVPGSLRRGGRLQMLKVPAHEDLRRGISAADRFDVEWVDISDPMRPHAGDDQTADGVYAQGKEQGASSFKRLEGCWFHQGHIYFSSTDGGDASKGQIWDYSTAANQLRLVFESPGGEVLDSPDNVTVSPRGGILVCEDGMHAIQRLQGLSVSGSIFPFAENNIVLAGERNRFCGDFRTQEWAGATFSRDGQWLFVNIQTPGITFAITGPWKRGLL